ncbi:MAG: hypothetical protein JWR61_487 [Ferruginibacter sp.]|uniref:hypothetical protein n=1 Tax=Ferruginibacter sp. TaxID=1940288 RepID=UPI00265A6E0D|nr:hypothetical protein [Ferruginibacter sp.]MDB5275532.1 hypothetical protein [Ferruginibacter sp.]
MKTFLKFSFGLFFAFIVANGLYLFLLPHIDWEFRKTKEAHGFKNQHLKVLVFGNSTAMDGVNTDLIDKHFGPAYNFSVGGASLLTNYIQLSDYLLHNERPEKVLLFLSSAHVKYYNPNEVNPIVDYYYGNSLPVSGLKDIPLFKFRWLVIENIKKLLSTNHRTAKIIKGQLRIKSIVPDNSSKKNDTTIRCLNESFYNNEGYEYMWRIASLCKERNIQFEVFELPCWKFAQNECADLVLQNKVIQNHFNLIMHNLNNYSKCDTLLDPNKDWLSLNHLNYNGSIKVTSEIIRILSR